MQMNHSGTGGEDTPPRAGERDMRDAGCGMGFKISHLESRIPHPAGRGVSGLAAGGAPHFSIFGAGATGGIPACATAWLNALTSVSRILRYSAREASRRPVSSL